MTLGLSFEILYAKKYYFMSMPSDLRTLQDE